MTDRGQTDYRDVSVAVNGGSPLNNVLVLSLNIHNEEVMNLLLFQAVLIAMGIGFLRQGNANLLLTSRSCRSLVDMHVHNAWQINPPYPITAMI